MQALRDREIGLMFWAGRDPVETLREVKSLGIRCGQLGVPGDLDLKAAEEPWKAALESEQFMLVTVFAAYTGESYADAATVQNTVGFIPPATRDQREKRTYEISEFAKALGVPSIACHIGFVPHDKSNPDYVAVKGMVQRVCDYAARNGQTFALETGQEPAQTLLDFIRDVNRTNLRINFDPANMILYGTGDPVEALEVVKSLVISVHCKDGDWPVAGGTGLGFEQPLGKGQVGMARFIAKLKEIGYTAPLNIEREVEDQAQRLADVKMAVGLLERLRS